MEKKDQSKNKKIISSLIAVIVLISALAIVSIVYNFLGGFYYCRVISFDKVLGEEQTILIDDVGAFGCACNFSGSLVVGADVRQPINIQAGAIDSPLYLRARFKINGLNFSNGYMYGYANWSQASDGYLYFNQVIEASEKVGLCSSLKINAQMDLMSSSNYIIIFVVEASETAWTYDVI